MLLIGPLRTNFSVISIEIQAFLLKNAYEYPEMAAIMSRFQCAHVHMRIYTGFI